MQILGDPRAQGKVGEGSPQARRPRRRISNTIISIDFRMRSHSASNSLLFSNDIYWRGSRAGKVCALSQESRGILIKLQIDYD